MKNSIKAAIFIAAIFILSFGANKVSLAQSLFLSPGEANFASGAVFTVKLKLDSVGQAINVAQATINFPSDLLEVKSISKAGSIFILWPQEPSYSNSSGVINFSGGLPSPGFTGTGTVLSVSFRAKKAGEARLSISGGVILAADGRGTNILSHTSGTIYEIAPKTKNILPGSASDVPDTAVSSAGTQGGISQNTIDNVPPEPFEVIVDNKGDPTLPTPYLLLDAKDGQSVIKEYELQIDGGEILSILPEKANSFLMPFQFPGYHELKVWAIDMAGNWTESETSFYIKSIPAPEILIYPKTYNSGEEMIYIEGRALPGLAVDVFFERENSIKTLKAVSDKDGNWSILTNELFKSGVYDISAKAKDQRGATSDFSKKYQVSVILNGFSFGSYMFTFKVLAEVLFILMILILIFIIYICGKIKKNRKKMQKETMQAQIRLKSAFEDLKSKLNKKIEYFDSKPGLSPKERKIRNEVFKILRESENAVHEEIKNVENYL